MHSSHLMHDIIFVVTSLITNNTTAVFTVKNTLSRRSRHAVMQSNRSRASECSLQEDLAMSWADPHVLVAPYAFGQVAPQVSEAAAQEQPFRVQVHPQVTFVSDLHAHMCDAEVIGLLAGKWDAKEKCLYIQSSFPCFSTVRIEDDGSTDVEMDPGAEIATREAIHRLDLQVVGWYHSHPCFRPDPSTTDIINQHSYQQLFRDAETNIEPFVGLIVSTFDPRRTSAESLHQWFHAVSFTNPLKAAKIADMYLPMRIEVCQLGVAAENCPIETRCSEESMRIMETKLLNIRVASEEREDNSEDKEDCVETVTLKDKEGVFEDAPPQKKSKLKEGKADEKLEGKRNDKENLVQMVVAPQAKGKRGRPRKIVPPQVGNIAQGALSVSHTTKDTVIPQPAVVSARGRSQKKRRFYDQDLTHPASPPSSAPLAHFSGSGGETYALQATVEGSSVSSFSGPGSETGLRAGAAASATTTGGSSRRSSRPPNSTTNRYGDYYHEEDEALKESLRRKIIKSKQKKSGKSIIATKSNTVPNTNVRYSINSNGSNCKNKTISTVSEATSSSNNSGSSMKMKGVSKDKEQQQAVVDIELDPPPLPPRYISLITGLQKDSSLASLARQLVCSAAPILQCSFLAIVTLGLYYSQHARRTTLTKPWRKKTKIDKIRSSIAVWLKYFGMCHSDEEKILDDVMEFLNLCWHDGNGNRR